MGMVGVGDYVTTITHPKRLENQCMKNVPSVITVNHIYREKGLFVTHGQPKPDVHAVIDAGLRVSMQVVNVVGISKAVKTNVIIKPD